MTRAAGQPGAPVAMLAFKAWCETRVRFIVSVVAMGGVVVFTGGWNARGATVGEAPQTIFLVLAAVLGGGSLTQERAVGSLGFTLALPVPRSRHLAARAAVGALEVLALATLVALLTRTPAVALTWGATGILVVCVALAFALLIASELVAWVAAFASVMGYELAINLAGEPGRCDVYRVMLGGLRGPVPWPALAGMLAAGIVALAIASIVQARREHSAARTSRSRAPGLRGSSAMLAYKAWCESRLRFAVAVAMVAVACAAFVLGEELLRSRMLAVGGPALSFERYVDVRVFAGVTRALFLVLAVVLGLGGLARERTIGTLGFTLALPVARWRHVVARAGVGISQLAAIAVVAVVLVPVCAAVVGERYAVTTAAEYGATWLAVGTIAFALGLGVSVIVRNEYAALAIAIVALRLLAPHLPFAGRSAAASAPVAPTGTAALAALPDTPAGRHAAWLIHGVVDDPSVRARLEPSMLAQSNIAAAISELAGHIHGATVTRVEVPNESTIVVYARVPEAAFALIVTVDAAGLIADLDVRQDGGQTAIAMPDLIADLARRAPAASFLVAEVTKTSCRPLHAYVPDQSLALASAFKLYVLLAVVDRIAAGELHWDESILVRDEWKSLPGGITQDEPTGTRLSVRTLAERMISISDNTATDVLLYTVGRERVEAAVRASGHAQPERNVPFLGTRELFLMKLTLDEHAIAAFAARPTIERRAVLDGLAGKPAPAYDEAAWQEPRSVATLEWFASATDLCQLAATLIARGDPTALAILARNPGMTPSAEFPYVGFKGGSEPGVLNGTWILRRRDDRWYVVTLGITSPRPVDEAWAVGLAQSAITLLSRAP